MNDDIFSEGVPADEESEPHVVAVGERQFDRPDALAEAETRKYDDPLLLGAVGAPYDAAVMDRR
jgi:hypothetical protein